MSALLSAWIAEMVVIAYRGAKTGTTANNPIPHLSLPSEYASTFIIFGALAFVPGEGQKVASAVGWGLVLATFLNLWNPGGTVKGAAVGADTAKPAAPSTPTNPTASRPGQGQTVPGLSVQPR